MSNSAAIILLAFAIFVGGEVILTHLTAATLNPDYPLHVITLVEFLGYLLIGIAGALSLNEKKSSLTFAVIGVAIWVYFTLNQLNYPINTPSFQEKMGVTGSAAWTRSASIIGVAILHGTLLLFSLWGLSRARISK